MADKETPAITSSPAKKEIPNADQLVKVRPLRTFHKDGNMQGEMVQAGDPPFDLPRGRAAELRANGLIAYESEDDDKSIHGESAAAEINERVQRDSDARKIAERHKTTPLRNPEVKLADVDASGSKK